MRHFVFGVLISISACGQSTATKPAANVPETAPAACSIGTFLDEKCPRKDGAYEIEGYVVAASADEIVLADGRGNAPQAGQFEGHVFVRPPPSPKPALDARARLRVTYDEVMFQNDPCCTPGPYIVHPAVR
jgi:hypothetical protein